MSVLSMEYPETTLLIPDYADHSQVYVDTVVDTATLNPPATSPPLDDRAASTEKSGGLLEVPGPSKRSSPPVIKKLRRSSATTAVDMCGTTGEVEFRVGKDRQLMIGSRSELASVSPVFRAMFDGQAHGKKSKEGKKQTTVEIPDVQTQSFGVIMRCAARDNEPPLTDDTVWNVLHAADQFQILPVVTRCFHFLLHRHSQRHQTRHLCTVMEKAHQLNYKEHQAKCLHRIKRHAGQVLKSAAALSELCHQCMLEIVTADDLPDVPETLILDAVVLWARAACRKNSTDAAEPSWEELRATAGPLVYQVRYLAMPRHTLQGLRAGEPSCLLNEKEKARLLEGDVSSFPRHVGARRGKKGWLDVEKLLSDVVMRARRKSKALLCVSVVFLVLVLLALVLLAVYLYRPQVFKGVGSSGDQSNSRSPVDVLMIQEVHP